MIRLSRLLAVVLLLLVAPALVMAQSAPQGVFATLRALQPRTYVAVARALAPAASATDFLSVNGVAGKTTRIVEASCDGTATAIGAAQIVGVIRSTADSAGTPTTLTAVPLDQADAAAGAVAKTYAANPTVGTLVGNVAAGTLVLTPPATSTIAVAPLRFSFDYSWGKPVVLRAATDTFALNGAGASLPAGAALNCRVVWTEQ